MSPADAAETVAVLGRRLQREYGEQWLHREKGDPWARLATGFDDDPGPTQDRIRTAGAVVRSSLGVHVTARYAVAAEAWSRPGLRPVLPTPAEPAGPVDLDAATRQVTVSGGGWDVAEEFAGPLSAAVLARLGADPAAAETAGLAMDALVCPQRLADARRLPADAGRPPTGGWDAAVHIGAGLLVNTVAALLSAPPAWRRVADDPDLIVRAVAETARWDPPVRMHVLVAPDGAQLYDAAIEPGGQLVLLTAAANRDPAWFAEPDRFRLDREAGTPPVLAPPGPFAVALAEAGVRALAARFPDLRSAAPVVRRRRAPVTATVLHLPVRSGPDARVAS